jgi:hypothetical protein
MPLDAQSAFLALGPLVARLYGIGAESCSTGFGGAGFEEGPGDAVSAESAQPGRRGFPAGDATIARDEFGSGPGQYEKDLVQLFESRPPPWHGRAERIAASTTSSVSHNTASWRV